MSEIDNILAFMIEIERLKGVLRKSRPVGMKRYENSAEHSWHVCLSALVLKDFANEAVNIDRVIRMLLIHDLGEIDVDDTIVYGSEKPELKAKEAAGVERILSYLPDSMRKEFMALWYEFEAGETADSKYARAIDRVPPLLHNCNDDGHGWKKHGITKEQVFALNSRIGQGSEELWAAVKQRLEEAVKAGILS